MTRHGLNVDSKNPRRARLAKMGGIDMVKVSPKAKPVQTSIDAASILDTGKRRINCDAYTINLRDLVAIV